MQPSELQIVNIADGVDPFEIFANGGTVPETPATTEDEDQQNDNDKGETTRKPSQQAIEAAKKVVGEAPKIDISDAEFDELLPVGLKNATGEVAEEEKPGEKKEGGTDGKAKETPDDTKIDETSAYTKHYRAMVALGKWEEDPDFDGTVDSYAIVAEKQHQKEINDGISQRLRTAMKDNPDGARVGEAFINHLAMGGTVADFQAVYADEGMDPELLDDEDDEVANDEARRIYTDFLVRQQWDRDDIQTRISKLAKGGLLVEETKSILKPWQKAVAAEKKELQETLEEADKKRKETARTFTTGLNEMLTKNHSFGSLKLYSTAAEMNELKDYFYKKGDDGATGYNKDMRTFLQEPTFVALMAKAMRERWHENPEKIFVNTTAVKSLAKKETQEKLDRALLNEQIDDKNEQITKQTPASKIRFNLDEALNGPVLKL